MKKKNRAIGKKDRMGNKNSTQYDILLTYWFKPFEEPTRN